MTNRLFIFLLSIICIFASCSDDNVEPSRENQDSSWNAIVVAGNVMDAEQHYNTVSLELKNASRKMFSYFQLIPNGLLSFQTLFPLMDVSMYCQRQIIRWKAEVPKLP